MTITEDQIIFIARAAHEVNRSYCESIGDDSQSSWMRAPSWQRASVIAGVVNMVKSRCSTSPEDSHKSWMKMKREAGWVLGDVKDVAKKTHPCMVPYHELPPEQRQKDLMFTGVVRMLILAIDP